MSFCRFSSDNWRCDVYCYEHVDGGFTTHVAGNRIVGDIPTEPSWDLLKDNPDQFMVEHNAVMAFLETCKRDPIGLPHDGAHFNDATLGDMRATLQMLKAEGYNVPAFVFDCIDEELAGSQSAD